MRIAHRLRWVAAWLLATAGAAGAQTSDGRITVHVARDTVAIEGALVRAGSVRVATASDGMARLHLPVGAALIIISKTGFHRKASA